jgi:hypothetical protein
MKLRPLVVVLALLAAFASDSRGESNQPPPSKQTTQSPTADQRGTDQVPFAVKILPAPDAKEQADKTERDRKEKAVVDERLTSETQRIADYTSRLAWFTFMLFGIAVLQAGLFFWQLRYMRQGMRDAEIAAKAADDSAKVARESVVLAENTAKRQLRAYLGLVHFDIQSERHEFVIVVRNDGQTPARQVTSIFNMQWYPEGNDLPADFAFPDYVQDRHGSDLVFINPKQEHPWSFEADWTKFSQFFNGEIAQLYLYGRFEYLDVFDTNWVSEFCYQAVRFPNGGGGFRAYNRHNNAT